MDNRVKVIKGMECCLPMTTRNGLADCKQCPYDRKITLEGGVTECCHDLMADALALLKEQEPRLITEADFENADAYGYLPAWVEDKDDNEIICDCITKYAITEPDEDYHYRYWTSRPTDEQREVIPWNL